jgi:signal transduction histidine kinase
MADSGTPRPGQGPWPWASTLDLDDLLEELRERAGVARRSNEQMKALLDAVVAISAGLEITEVLARIVRSACTLVGARYGALGILGPDREHLVEFVTEGMSVDERQRIGDLPRGHGILGLLTRNPKPLRISEIASHPEAYGFPPNHPPMTSFLGAPVRVRDEVFGNLYLTEKEAGKEFTEEDEALIVALAAAAGVAIENARLYERSQTQRGWSLAISEVTQALLQSETEQAALEVMAEEVCRVAEATGCAVALAREGARPAVAVIRGPGGPVKAGPDAPTVLAGPQWTSVLDLGQPLLLVPEQGGDAFWPLLEEVRRIIGLADAVPTALVPIRAGAGEPVGLLIPVWDPGGAETASDALEQLQDFAHHVGLALLAARGQQDRAALTLLGDRERIARDMHDNVIQRLFATGLSLQSAGRFAQHPVVRERLDAAIDDLDAAIKDIRQTIYELHSHERESHVGQAVTSLVQDLEQILGFRAELDLRGDTAGADPDLEIDLLAVVREALTNVARHAKATAATVSVTFGDSTEVVVVDNGVGMSAGQRRRSGLANLAERAATRSGTFEVSPEEPHGTRLTWTVPGDVAQVGDHGPSS